jgi:hypothetical protein
MVFQGVDSEFRRLVQIMGESHHQLHKEYGDMEIFLLPPKNGKFGLGVYLANKDIWYSRFVYNVFRDNGVFPDFIPDTETKHILPHFLQESTIQMYLREASRFVDIRVCKATLRFAATTKQPQVVYFCQHLAVGSTAYTEVHRKLK